MALVTEPAVSMMSSTMMAILSRTSPMKCRVSATLCSGRILVSTARSHPGTRLMNRLASLTPPASADTATSGVSPKSL